MKGLLSNRSVVSLCWSVCIESLCGVYGTNTRSTKYSAFILMCFFSDLPPHHLHFPTTWLDCSHFLTLQTKKDFVAKKLASPIILSLNLIITCFCQLSLKIFGGKYVCSSSANLNIVFKTFFIRILKHLSMFWISWVAVLHWHAVLVPLFALDSYIGIKQC